MKSLLKQMSGVIKAFLVFSLALFQVSFFMKPDVQINGRRDVAQELGTTAIPRNMPGELSLGKPVDEPTTIEVTVESEGIDNEESDEDSLIPKNLPKNASIKEAISDYRLRKTQCLVRQDDVESMDEQIAFYIDAKDTSDSDPTEENIFDKKMALTELARTLVSLEFLEPFEKESSISDEDSEDDLDLEDIEDIETEDSAPRSVLLNPEIPEELKEISECHLAILESKDSDAEKQAYYETHIEGTYVDELGNKIDSPKDLQTLGGDFTELAGSTDEINDNKTGEQFEAFTHAQSAAAVSAVVTSLKSKSAQLAVNPSDATLQLEVQSLKNQLQAELIRINSEQKTNAAKLLLSTNPSSLSSVNAKIDSATLFWSNQASALITGDPSATWAGFNPTTTPSAASNAGLVDSLGQKPQIFTEDMLNGNYQPTADISGNPMSTPVLDVLKDDSSMRRSGYNERLTIDPKSIVRSTTGRPRPGANN